MTDRGSLVGLNLAFYASESYSSAMFTFMESSILMQYNRIPYTLTTRSSPTWRSIMQWVKS